MKVTNIRENRPMMKKIREFLSTRGYEFGGGSIVEDDGQTTTWIMLDTHSAVISSTLGRQLKEALEAERLVLNGLVY